MLLENSGGEHQLLNNLKVTFKKKGSDKPLVLERKDLKGFTDENILAKHERAFYIESSALNNFYDKTVEASLTFDQN
jgi:hypothetical protein